MDFGIECIITNYVVSSGKSVTEKEVVMPKFKKGDVVRLNNIGKSNRGLLGCIPNPCSKRLLAGEALKISNVVSVFQGSRYFSLNFYDGSYSYSEDFFEKLVS